MFVFTRVKKHIVNQQPTSIISYNFWPQLGKQSAGPVLRQTASTVTEKYYWNLLFRQLLFMNILRVAMIYGIGGN